MGEKMRKNFNSTNPDALSKIEDNFKVHKAKGERSVNIEKVYLTIKENAELSAEDPEEIQKSLTELEIAFELEEGYLISQYPRKVRQNRILFEAYKSYLNFLDEQENKDKKQFTI